MKPPSERRFPRIAFAKVDAKNVGGIMKWGSWSGAFSSFIIHPSTLRPRLTADSPDLLAVIKQEGNV